MTAEAGWGGVAAERPARLQAQEGSERGGVPAPRSWPLRPALFFMGRSPRFTRCPAGSPRGRRQRAVSEPIPGFASPETLDLSKLSPEPPLSSALCGRAVWPLRENMGRACGLEGHTVVGVSPTPALGVSCLHQGKPGSGLQRLCFHPRSLTS